jgi:uncharacterized protein
MSDNGKFINDLYDAFASGDVPRVMGAMDDGIEWKEAEGFMYGGTYIGPNAVLENVFMKLGTEWEGFTVVPDEIIDGGDKVVATGTYSGKYLKTGNSMSVPFAHVWTIENGKITKFAQFTDTAVIARDLGL